MIVHIAARQIAARQYVVACLLVIVVVAGCSRSDTVQVDGTVTWNGVALPDGEVMFIPSDPRTGPAAGRIVKGEFTFRTKPGRMRVEIQSARLTGKREPVSGTPISELFVPARYNTKSELSVDVEPDGANHFDFPLVQ